MLKNNNYNFVKKREQFKYLKTKHSFLKQKLLNKNMLFYLKKKFKISNNS